MTTLPLPRCTTRLPSLLTETLGQLQTTEPALLAAQLTTRITTELRGVYQVSGTQIQITWRHVLIERTRKISVLIQSPAGQSRLYLSDPRK